MGWHQTQNKEFLDICLKRMEGPVLTWVEQSIEILGPFFIKSKNMNDIGCNVGQFLKGLKEKKVKIKYNGYDLEPIYLKNAQKFFPKNKNGFRPLNISSKPPLSADISVSSATIEHLDQLRPGLDNILKSTKKVVLIRTFLGEETKRSMLTKKRGHPYPVNQYAFSEILSVFNQYGFATKVIRDRYTDSMPKYITENINPNKGVLRTHYIILGIKKQNEK